MYDRLIRKDKKKCQNTKNKLK